jgi:hypothetical protein
VGVDARKFDFTAVQWYGLFHSNGSEDTFDEAFDKEINGIREKGETGSPYTLLAQACRRLSANAEDNREYPLANDFQYWAMDAVRKEQWNHIKSEKTWRSIWEHLGPITTFYWALSGYGVRAGRALGVLLTIAVVFAVLYMIVGHPSLRVLPIVGIWQALADAGRALMYSLGVMARLRPEPIPKEMGMFQILVTVEGILGPLQIALLALAVRRKVMR